MDTETVLAQILPKVSTLLKALVEQIAAVERPTLYTVEEQTQAVLPQIGQVVLQALAVAQGSGLDGPERACGICGGSQRYHDRQRPLSVTSSLGVIQIAQRAYYVCSACGTTATPLDEQLGLGQAGQGRMSRYLQEQCSWLLALVPARLARQTLRRFGWPAVAASQIREHGAALGADLERREQAQRVTAQAEAARPPAQQGVPRQPPRSDRLYAAPDGVMYCTTTRDAVSGKAVWRELKVAAVYEREAEREAEPAPSGSAPPPTARQRIVRSLHAQVPTRAVAPADHGVRVTYIAETDTWQAFGGRLWAELWARGLGRPVHDLAVVADGSDHIDQAVDSDLRVPDVRLTRILDLPHAQQHLWTVAKAIFGEDHAGSARGTAWVQPVLCALEQGQVATVVTALHALADETPDGPAGELAPTRAAGVRAARQAAAYFTQRHAQAAYPDFVADGYQIGSGLAESACKRFGTNRMKGAGMRWTVPGAQAVATLRMLVLSDRWNEVSQYCRSAA